MENSQNSTINEDKLKPNFADAKYATGKRKRSIARVWIKKGSGDTQVIDPSAENPLETGGGQSHEDFQI